MRNSNYVSYRNYRNPRGAAIAEVMVFVSLTEVEKVLDKLKNSINEKGHATIAEYYELTGGSVFDGDAKWGWTDLLGCNISMSRYGYELRMPMTTRINMNPILDAYNVLVDADDDNLSEAVNEAMDYLVDLL